MNTSKNSKKILIADDNQTIRILLQYNLKKEGYETILACDGQEAIEKISDEIYVALIDMKMPRLDGLGCLSFISKNFPDIPVIIVTATGDLSNAVEAMKKGAYDYITKPVDINELIMLVHQAGKSGEQSRRLKLVEKELEKAKEKEARVSSEVQQTFLLGHSPKNMLGFQVAEYTISSLAVAGDFYDFFLFNDCCLDIVVGDVMGKGIAAAFFGAAIKSRLQQARYNLHIRNPNVFPAPEKIISLLHSSMIDDLARLETFATLCYARFDNIKREILIVDCGHLRTIHYHADVDGEDRCTLLEGYNMPLGFPCQDEFQQISAPFKTGDLFFFYSDGITEAVNADGEMFNEERLVKLINELGWMDPQDMVKEIEKNLIEFSGSGNFTDDVTSVAVRIKDCCNPDKQDYEIGIRNDLSELKRLRAFIHELCLDSNINALTDEIETKINLAVQEAVTNIMRHAQLKSKDELIRIEASVLMNKLEINILDNGIAFDPETVEDPKFDGSRDGGFGVYLINEVMDKITYSRDDEGINCMQLIKTIEEKNNES